MRDRIGRHYSNDWQVINHPAILIKAAGTPVAELGSLVFSRFLSAKSCGTLLGAR